jgi:hypothetical protein
VGKMLKTIFTILILVFTELKTEDPCFEDQKTVTCFMIVEQASKISRGLILVNSPYINS